ncbi:MAG: type II toxin-antitoxin system Phd/YefM family antitoxin [Candidatus Dadabacteria bacterium]|nr:MAG: type II toxin-antitoxin system Phd/YefM family antitoxin [Candidatus Dadabacteria bacterium]
MAIQVTIHEAKTHLSRLLRLVIQGEEVIIAKGSRPIARLEALEGVRPERHIGSDPGLIVSMSDDFDEPLDDFVPYMR